MNKSTTHYIVVSHTKRDEEKMLLILLLAFDVPDVKPCVIDMCEGDICVIETPEGIIEAERKPSYYEGKRLSIDECPIDQIEPT